MRVTVLTSSRADYSIYFPLLKNLKSDSFFDLKIIAFGTHLSDIYGYTINKIKEDGFVVIGAKDTMPDGDLPIDISNSIGKCIKVFAEIWEKDDSDLIIVLGDRYEMFAACTASIPFGKTIAHIHGGEITLGAIDDVFRHAITLMSTYHFVTTDTYKNKVIDLIGNSENVFNVGALSIDNLAELELLDLNAFKEKFAIDLSIPSILITFHPETVDFERNETFCYELINALDETKDYQFVITMPNADTMGARIREMLLEFVSRNNSAIAVESFGTIGYLSCMKHCSFMLGNTSSGFVEASFFPKFVINIGNRQDGRIITENIRNCKIEKNAIRGLINEFPKITLPDNISVYGDGNTSNRILSIIKNIYSELL